MTPERKVIVNRRLAEFARFETDTWQTWPYNPPDYTADLNALARLEAKLPPHRWAIFQGHANIYFDEPLDCGSDAEESTEAEARAEAICQYLESRK